MTTPAVGDPNKKPIPINPTPKQRFQAGLGNISSHHSLIDLDGFQRGADAALLEYCRALADQVKDGNTALAAGFRLLGAHEVMSTLKTLGEQHTPLPPKPDFDNLVPQQPKRQ